MMKPKLLENWIVVNSKTHPDRVYYFNVRTKQSSWKEPPADQTEQVKNNSGGSPRKRSRKSMYKDEDRPAQPTTPEIDVSKKEISQRKKLVAKRSLKQTQEKSSEGKDTPQMKAIREKMLKRKEKNNRKAQSSKAVKSSKDVTKSPVSESDKISPLAQKSDINSKSKTTYTPQMQVLLQRMEERVLKQSSKTKKSEKAVADKFLVGKKKEEELHSVKIVSSTKQSRKSLKKNLGKERMEKLRKSLTEQINDSLDHDTCTPLGTTPVQSSEEKLPSIYKNPEVRLVRLQKKFINDKISTNKTIRIEREETANSSKEPAEATDDLIQLCKDDSICEEMDWEPLEDDKITFEVQAIRMQLCTENNTNTPRNLFNKSLNYPLLSARQTKRHLYIVVDTNVFLSNINAIELAKETTLKTYDLPLIVIPWTVVRELDYIKSDNGKTKPTILCMKARKAINYINKLFSTKDPRIITQTPEDVAKNKEKFSIDCPDDEILQTCLQIRDMGKSVVLLSYDVNLCNKAMIYDLVTLGRNDPLEKIDYLNASNYINVSLCSSNLENSLKSTSILSQEVSLADEIYEDIKSIMRDFLTVVVSKEMHVLYGDSWEKYVLIKPPWTTVSVLQCAVKHWIAAVSDSFQRKAEIILKDLLEIFKNGSGRRSLKENSYLLDKCSALVQLVDVDKHSDLMLRISKKIDELKKKCHEFETQINERKLCDEIGFESSVDEQERRAQKAFQYFEAAYVYARDMCGLAAETIRMPCTFNYNIPDPLPSVSYVKQIQLELALNVNKLSCSLNTVMEEVKNSSATYRTLADLYQALTTFLPENEPIAIKLMNVNLMPLDVYYCIKRKEDVLNRGLRQLQELNTHFCRMANHTCV